MPRHLSHFVMTAVLMLCSVMAQTGVQNAVPAIGASRVTAASGESWLNHLHRSFNETSMGKTNHLGPPPPAPGEPEASNWKLGVAEDLPREQVMVRGSDLYRLNCQGCHRDSGLGAPPEINSIIGPIRATSAVLVLDRMRSMGMEVSRRGAIELAQQATTSLWQRLRAGGQDMPAFAYLNPAEMQALVAYLREMAGVPGAERDQRILRESPVRVGELTFKSTCHICHDAIGPNPSPEQLEQGAIPPLATLLARTNFAGFVRKVTAGAPFVSGDAAPARRGRMPVFNYLTQKEAADVYLYLTLYPPAEIQSGEHQILASTPPTTVTSAALTISGLSNGSLAHRGMAGEKQADDWVPLLLMLGTVWFTVHLLAGGMTLTIHEFKRMSEQSKRVRTPAQKVYLEGQECNPRSPFIAGRGKELMPVIEIPVAPAKNAADGKDGVQSNWGSYGTTKNAQVS